MKWERGEREDGQDSVAIQVSLSHVHKMYIIINCHLGMGWRVGMVGEWKLLIHKCSLTGCNLHNVWILFIHC